jgi:hypothetical protein
MPESGERRNKSGAGDRDSSEFKVLLVLGTFSLEPMTGIEPAPAF